jgi:hypothetical protein
MRRQPKPFRMFLSLLLLPAIVGSSGCALLYQLYVGDGHVIDAKYPGLKGQRVAVVCMMNPSQYGDGATSTLIAERVEFILGAEVEDISVVRQDEVVDWMDVNDWDETDYVEIGRGVNADMVVAIDVEAFSTHDGSSSTLLKGRADVTTTVYDLTQGSAEVFRTRDPSFEFPTSHAIPAISTDAREFERIFIERLSHHIAKNFYDYNMAEDFAQDGAAYAH